MYLGSAKSSEEGSIELYLLPAPFCSDWAQLLHDSTQEFVSFVYVKKEPSG